jgi:hypothetical protein
MGEEKSETQVLFPEIQVAGIKVRPWTFDQFFDLIPIFVEASEYFKREEIKFEEIEAIVKDRKKMLSIIASMRPAILTTVATTIESSVEEVRAMEFDKVISIALVVLIQNAERIKNFSGLGKTALNSLVTS